jgi:hypothetical protein
MTSKPAPKGNGHGFFQGLLQFFTSATGMIAAFLALVGALVTLAATQYGDAGSSPPSGTRAPESSSWPPDFPKKTSAQDSINQSIADTASSSSVDLVEAQIRPQLQAQLQAQVPDAVVSVKSVDCSAPDNGTCTTAVSDSLGNNTTLNIAYAIIEPSTGAFQWQVTGSTARGPDTF